MLKYKIQIKLFLLNLHGSEVFMCCVCCITIHVRWYYNTHRVHACCYQLALWDSRSYGTIHTWKLSLSHLMLAQGATNSVDETLLWDAYCCWNIQATPYPLLNTEVKISPLYSTFNQMKQSLSSQSVCWRYALTFSPHLCFGLSFVISTV